MHVLLVHPNATSPRPELHLGLAYVAACLQQRGHTVSIWDTKVASAETFERSIAQGSYGFVGITAHTLTMPEAVDLARRAKRIAPQTPVVAGGPHVSMVGKLTLNHPCIDFAVVGEGEETAPELAALLERGDPSSAELRTVRGLIFRDGESIVTNEPRPFIRDLDSLPHPALQLFDLDRYITHRVIMTRGCPNHCNFCLVNSLWSKKLRFRSVPNIVAEIRHVIERYGYKTITFSDDLFNFSEKWALELCQAFIDERLDIVWSAAGIRLSHISEELVAKMAEAGCGAANVGIQSIDDQVLVGAERGDSSADIKRALDILVRSGIPVWGQFMIGNVGDTLETVKKSLAFARASGLRAARFYVAIPFYRTGLWSYVEQHGTFLPERDETCVSYYHAPDHIPFVTPEFSYQDRKEAIALARAAGCFALGDEYRASAVEGFVYYRLLNGLLFKMLPNRANRRLMKLLSRGRTAAITARRLARRFGVGRQRSAR